MGVSRCDGKDSLKLRVFALDYDGTIASNGLLHSAVRSAIENVRARGIVVVLVTGRILSDLRALVGDLRLFDAVVAENGAVATFPGSGHSTQYAPRCPEAFLKALAVRGLEARAGECVVELDASAAHGVLDAVRETELPLTLHFNRGRLMVLPPAVSKATGLRAALHTMRLSVHNAIGVGDAENDHELLGACEVGAAVEWGSASLRAGADVVIAGDGPEAVARYVESTTSTRISHPRPARRRLVLGRAADASVVSLAVRGRNVLIAGDPRSGKSWVAGLLCEQLILQGYCVCLLDPEGDYTALEALPGVVVEGGEAPAPSMNELARILSHADTSVVVDLSRLSQPAKREYVLRALRMLYELRRRTGLPHRIVVDEAHYFLHGAQEANVLDHELAGYTLVTYRTSDLHPDVLAASECVVVTRATDAAEIRLLRKAWLGTEELAPGTEDLAQWEELLRGLELDQAVLLPLTEESGGRLRPFRLAARLTRHVRHRNKYMDVPVSGIAAFRFSFDDGTEGPVVGSLHELVEVLSVTPQERIAGHLRRGDLSRWIRDVFADAYLAQRMGELEESHRLGELPDFNGAAVEAVLARYEVDEKVV